MCPLGNRVDSTRLELRGTQREVPLGEPSLEGEIQVVGDCTGWKDRGDILDVVCIFTRMNLVCLMQEEETL